MAEACRLGEGNPGLDLGLSLGDGWEEGRDKVCVPDPHGFGLWVEQLVAESTGKEGKGLVPAPGESPDGPDRQAQEVRARVAVRARPGVLPLGVRVAVAGSILGINPFDQPNVQAAKDRTNEVLARRRRRARRRGLGRRAARLGAASATTSASRRSSNPTPRADERSRGSPSARREATGCVVTHGYGPRYLHSTGQLHKGGPNNGVFIQVVDDTGDELKIPGQPFGFGRLIRAQAAGDFASLRERGRRVGRVHMEDI